MGIIGNLIESSLIKGRLISSGAFDPLGIDSLVILDGAVGALNPSALQASYLDGIQTWQNQSSSGLASDVAQTTPLLQGKYLTPGNSGPAMHFPGVLNNLITVPDANNLSGFDDFTFQVDGLKMENIVPGVDVAFLAKYLSSTAQREYVFYISSTGTITLYLCSDGVTVDFYTSTHITSSAVGVRVIRSGTTIKFYEDDGTGYSQVGLTRTDTTGTLFSGTSKLNIGGLAGLTFPFYGKMERVRIWNTATPDSSTPVLDSNFQVDCVGKDHASSYVLSSGQVGTLITSGDSPCAIIEYPCIRFDGVDDAMLGTFSPVVSGTRAFVVADVLGGGGEAPARVLILLKAGTDDWSNIYSAVVLGRVTSTTTIRNYYNSSQLSSISGGYSPGKRLLTSHFNGVNGTSLRVNDVSPVTNATDVSQITATHYGILRDGAGGSNAALDIQYIALFPSSMSDSDSDKMTSYLNDRFNIW